MSDFKPKDMQMVNEQLVKSVKVYTEVQGVTDRYACLLTLANGQKIELSGNALLEIVFAIQRTLEELGDAVEEA